MVLEALLIVVWVCLKDQLRGFGKSKEGKSASN